MMRERLSVRGLDRTVVHKFKEYVKAKYGKLHTVYGIEVEKALREYLKKYTYSDEPTHTGTEEEKQNQGRRQEHKHKAGNSAQVAYANAGENHRKLSISPSERTKRKIIRGKNVRKS